MVHKAALWHSCLPGNNGNGERIPDNLHLLHSAAQHDNDNDAKAISRNNAEKNPGYSKEILLASSVCVWMSSLRWTLLVRCSTTLLEQRDAHVHVHSLCNQKQRFTNNARMYKWLLMFPVQVLSTLKWVLLNISRH